MQIDAMNLVILIIGVYIVWSAISSLIDNPARNLARRACKCTRQGKGHKQCQHTGK